MDTNMKYILRSPEAGVFYGEIKKADDITRVFVLKNARQIWYWDGAATLMQLSSQGTSRPELCKITVPVEEVTIMNVVQYMPCTEQAVASLDAVEPWVE